MLGSMGQMLGFGRGWTLRIGAAGLVMSLAASAHAACQVYEGQAFSGSAVTISDNASRADLGLMNDKVSSVKIGPQCLMQAYADPDFKGAQTTFGPGDHPRLIEGWDDQISSARCNCR